MAWYISVLSSGPGASPKWMFSSTWLSSIARFSLSFAQPTPSCSLEASIPDCLAIPFLPAIRISLRTTRLSEDLFIACYLWSFPSPQGRGSIWRYKSSFRRNESTTPQGLGWSRTSSSFCYCRFILTCSYSRCRKGCTFYFIYPSFSSKFAWPYLGTLAPKETLSSAFRLFFSDSRRNLSSLDVVLVMARSIIERPGRSDSFWRALAHVFRKNGYVLLLRDWDKREMEFPRTGGGALGIIVARFHLL